MGCLGGDGVKFNYRVNWQFVAYAKPLVPLGGWGLLISSRYGLGTAKRRPGALKKESSKESLIRTASFNLYYGESNTYITETFVVGSLLW